MVLYSVRFISLLSSALLAGTLAGVRVFLSPATKTFSASTYTQVKQANDRAFVPKIVYLFALTNVSNLVVLLLDRDRWTPAYGLNLIALACGLAYTATTLRVNVPINKAVESWSVQSPPADWADVRDRWERYHTFRAVMSVVALGCQLLGVLSLIPRTKQQGGQHR